MSQYQLSTDDIEMQKNNIPPNIHKARIVVMPRKERDVNSN